MDPTRPKILHVPSFSAGARRDVRGRGMAAGAWLVGDAEAIGRGRRDTMDVAADMDTRVWALSSSAAA